MSPESQGIRFCPLLCLLHDMYKQWFPRGLVPCEAVLKEGPQKRCALYMAVSLELPRPPDMPVMH